MQQVRLVPRAWALLQLGAKAGALRLPEQSLSLHRPFGGSAIATSTAGLDGALYEKPRTGAAEVLDANQKQRMIAMVGSDPPEGCARSNTSSQIAKWVPRGQLLKLCAFYFKNTTDRHLI